MLSFANKPSVLSFAMRSDVAPHWSTFCCPNLKAGFWPWGYGHKTPCDNLMIDNRTNYRMIVVGEIAH